MIDRRTFLAGTGALLLVAPVVVEAQLAGKVWRIAYLGNSSAVLESELIAAFRQGLRDLNYVEGQNVVIEFHWAEGQYDRFPTFVAEAIQAKVDVIVSAATVETVAAKRATSSIPIVMWLVPDPVAQGAVGSLARPGANVTGL